MNISAEVQIALSENKAVVALESPLITHGFPSPKNLLVAKEIEDAVRQEGAVPATIAILDGQITVGLSESELARLAASDARKCSVRDLPLVIAQEGNGGTTVAATMVIARQAGIPVFATGGIGGVHRGAETTFDISADLYELAMDRLMTAGYVQYEISNWARLDPDGRWWTCRHNLIYWHNGAWLGFGPGAHSGLGGRRWANVLSPEAYIARIQAGRSPVDWQEEIGPRLSMGETMMLGLRLVREGVRATDFERRYGRSLEAVFGPEIEDLVRAGLVERVNGAIRLTRRGRLLGNQVFMRFLPVSE